MSNCTSARIHIGGSLSKAQFGELLGTVGDQYTVELWGHSPDQEGVHFISSVAEVEELAELSTHWQNCFLAIEDSEVHWGEFDLENWLFERKIPFNRWSGPLDECDAELVCYSGGEETGNYTVSYDWSTVYADRSPVDEAKDPLNQALEGIFHIEDVLHQTSDLSPDDMLGLVTVAVEARNQMMMAYSLIYDTIGVGPQHLEPLRIGD